jgi:hypothetical protein
MEGEQLSKREIKRLRRLERKRGVAAFEKAKRFKEFFMWGGLVVIVGGALWWWFGTTKQYELKKPGLAYPNQGQDHIAVNASHPAYNSNPPTSGWHYASPANWGIYDTSLPDEQLIHNLEHGGIWISYQDKNNTELITQLRQLVGKYRSKVILTPRPENDASIVVAAWTQLLKLETFDAAAIEDFIKAFRNKGPELVPD